MSSGIRQPHAQALAIARFFEGALAEVCARIMIVGSLRRCSPTVGDIEILAEPKFEERQGRDLFRTPVTEDLLEERIAKLQQAEKLFEAAGGNRYKKLFLVADGKISSPQIDLFIVRPPTEWAVSSVIRTGPALLSRLIMSRLREHGMHCEGNQILGFDGTHYPCSTEEDVFRLAGLQFMPPERRG